MPSLAVSACVVATALAGGAVEGRAGTSVGSVPIDFVTSKVVANPTDPIAGSPSGSTVTVTLVDSTGHPVAGQTMEIVPNVKDAQGHVAAVHVAPLTGVVTDGHGVATFVVSTPPVTTVSQLPESGTIAAKVTSDGGVQLDRLAPISFVSGQAVSQTQSAVTVNPAVVIEDMGRSGVQVVLRDNAGAPLPFKHVEFASVTAHGRPALQVSISPASSNTGADGKATFTVHGSTVGTATLEAKDVTDNLVLGEVSLEIATPTEPDVARSSITASPTSVPADGVTKAMITVTLLNADGKPLQQVVTVGAESARTDVNGQATFALTEKKAGTVHLHVRTGGPVAGGGTTSQLARTTVVFSTFGSVAVTFTSPTGTATTTTKATTTTAEPLTPAEYRAKAGAVCSEANTKLNALNLNDQAGWIDFLTISQTAYHELAALTPPTAVAPLVKKVLAELNSGINAYIPIVTQANLKAHPVSEIFAEIAKAGQAVLSHYDGVTTKSLWTQIGVPECK